MSGSQPMVISVNVGPGGIPKTPVERAEVTFDGMVGDAHDHDKHNTPVQALSLLDVEDLDDFREEGFDVYPGAAGENLTCRGVDVDQLEAGDRLHFSGGVVAEITKRRTPCFVLDAIDPRFKKAAIGRVGCYAKVIEPGAIEPGETIEVVSASRVL